MCRHPGGIHLPRALGKIDRGKHPSHAQETRAELARSPAPAHSVVLSFQMSGWNCTVEGVCCRGEGVASGGRAGACLAADLLPPSSPINAITFFFTSFPIIFLCE